MFRVTENALGSMMGTRRIDRLETRIEVFD
jgi:hypothetical protein